LVLLRRARRATTRVAPTLAKQFIESKVADPYFPSSVLLRRGWANAIRTSGLYLQSSIGNLLTNSVHLFGGKHDQ